MSETAMNLTAQLSSKQKDSERYKNAEILARALKAYQLEETSANIGSQSAPSRARGRSKDSRICQLNAAFKYCAHLEQAIKEFCDKENAQIPDDCKLITNAKFTLATDRDNEEVSSNDESSSMNSYLTPNQKNNASVIHESSLAIASSSTTNAMCSSGGVLTRSRAQQLRNFKNNVVASPILGPGHYVTVNEVEHDLSELRSRLNRKRRITEQQPELEISNLSNLSTTNTSKRANRDSSSVNNSKKSLLDLNNNEVAVATPKSETENESNGERKQYFLRSRKNSQQQQHQSLIAQTAHKRQMLKKNLAKSAKLDSSMGSSSRSSSLTTTPSISNTRASSDASSSSSSSSVGHSSLHELESMDARQLLKVDMSQEQLEKILDLNQSELHRSRNGMSFI